MLPFPRENGGKIIFRPAFNVPVDDPFFDTASGRFNSDGGFGDIGFDLVYAPKTEGKVSYGLGIVGGIPTGTNADLRSGNWTAGPEVFVAYIDDWGLVGGLITPSWDVAGWGEDTSISSFQYFYFLGFGDGCATPASSAGRPLPSSRQRRYDQPGLSLRTRDRRGAGHR